MGKMGLKKFADLGLVESLCEACSSNGFVEPTLIQEQAIPVGLQGKDVIGVAQTGSGKTVAFALPILQHLLDVQQPFFACILAPTRELAIQIGETFEILGASIGLRCAVLVGGIDMMTQAMQISKKPHILVATPGRLLDHLENTKGFNLKNLRFLVLDEADRLLDLDFGPEIDKLLKVIPRERTTFLFSATMTSKVEKLQRACLRDPVKVEVSTKYQTVDTLMQHYLFIPAKFKECYLTYLLTELVGSTIIVFTSTCNAAQKLSLIVENLGLSSICIHGQMSQSSRLAALAKFKSGDKMVLFATDVASRGLDIPSVDVVLNYDVPMNPKDYIHRVGRTARAGRSGKAVTIVTQYDIELYKTIEAMIDKQLPEFPIDKEKALLIHERVMESQRLATIKMRDQQEVADRKKKKSKGITKNKRR